MYMHVTMKQNLLVSFGFWLAALLLVGHQTGTLRRGVECSEEEKIVQRSPGLVVQDTEDVATMNYQNSLRAVMDDLLKHKAHFDFSGKVTTLLWSTIRYKLTRFILIGFDQPISRVSMTRAKGIVINTTLPILKFKGQYTMELHNGQWLQYSRKGDIRVTVSGSTAEFNLEFTAIEETDRVNRSTPNCSANINGGIDVDLQDSVSNSLIAGINWDEEMEPHREQLCRLLRIGMDGKLDFSYRFTKDIYLDMSMPHTPEIYDGYFVTQHVGEVRYVGDDRHFPHPPQPLVITKPTHLAAYKFSDFIFNSFGYVVHNHNLLSFVYTKSDLPDIRRYLLDTTCESECFGTLFPNASTRWPDSSVELNFTTAEAPFVQITLDSFKVNLRFNIEAHARLSNTSSPLLFSIQLSLSTFVASSVKNNRIHFQMKNPDANITIVESRIGDLPEAHLLVVINQAFQKILYPLMKQFAMDGIGLDFSRYISVNEYECRFTNGHLSLIVTSVSVKEKDKTADQRYVLRVILNLFLFSALR